MPANEDFSRIKRNVISKKSEQALSLGYPFYLKRARSKKGKYYEWIEPIFFLTYDTDSHSISSTP